MLEAVDEMTATMITAVSTLVQIPSVSGTDAENDAQHHVATLMDEGGLDIDQWQIDLADMYARSDFLVSKWNVAKRGGSSGVCPEWATALR